MAKRGHGARFALEPLTPDRIRGNVSVQDLDRDGAIKAGVAGFVDLSHSPCANTAEAFIRAKAYAGHQRHRWKDWLIIRSPTGWNDDDSWRGGIKIESTLGNKTIGPMWCLSDTFVRHL
jgi:hypothetical protein